MPYLRLHHACSLSLLLVISLAAPSAHAQWAWRDSRGTRQYSVIPPPPSVPEHRIVRQPGATAAPETPDSKLADTPAESSTPAWFEQNAEFMKRREQRREQDKKAQEQKLAAEKKRKDCTVARENLRIIESSRPLRQASDKGGSELMRRNQREAEAAKIREFLKDCS